MNAWIDTALSLAATRAPFVIVTVAATRGSTPREAGARMFVTRDEVLDTIGGGQLEHQCTAIACEWLRSGKPARAFTRRFTLGANLGQCCGGVADMLFEPVEPGQAEWLDAVAQRRARNEPFVIATVLATDGVEKHLLPAADAPAALDERARTLLAGEHCIRRESAEYRPGLHVPVVLERVGCAAPEIAVFGAGHVGSALVSVLAPLHEPIRWIDSRAGIFPATTPALVQTLGDANPSSLVAGLSPGATVLIMTHSHPQDLAICAEALRRDDLVFCGLIGSVSKRRQFERRLRSAGLDEAQLARLTCPIGVAGIAGKRPAEIAIAVAAQVLRVREAALRSAGDNTRDRAKAGI